MDSLENHKDKSPIQNQKGQMTIFIVLVFQVLFVFFAMVSNVGLVVHEKINVQNASDLAAMYGAQKQAEVLNAIGHLNYQIRQAWKMLAFRVRVLGDFGRQGHPLRQAIINGTMGADSGWGPVTNFNPQGGAGSNVYPPMVCVTHGGWVSGMGGATEDNLCQSSNGQLGTPVEELPNITIFFPGIDNIVQNQFQNLNQQITSSCDGAGIKNWMVAAKFMTSFRFDVYNKLRRIKALKEKLENGIDIEGNSIAEGAEKTFKANLTSENQVLSFSWINPFDQLSASYRSYWLRPINVFPTLFFIGNMNASGVACAAKRQALHEINGPGDVQAPGGSYVSHGLYSGSALLDYSKESGAPTAPWSDGSMLKSTVGIQKNPWVMVYSGVKVTTQARKPFFPVGKAHQITAKSFAQPFGSSIGPWESSKWEKGPTPPSGGQKIDPMLPDAWLGEGPPPTFQNQNVPNYSRYPGDQWGLGSKLALSEIGAAWRNISANSPISLEFYKNQPLYALNGGLGISERLSGRLEALAVAPNTFDITYYNIEPMAQRLFNVRDSLNISNVAPDYKEQNSSFDGIYGQIEDAKNRGLTAVAPLYRVNDWTHLLTSWVAKDPSNYEADVYERFGKCTTPVNDGESPTSGNCVAGGRVGYSVKLVSEDYLNSNNLALGGEGAAVGSIANPPPGG